MLASADVDTVISLLKVWRDGRIEKDEELKFDPTLEVTPLIRPTVQEVSLENGNDPPTTVVKFNEKGGE